MKASLAQWLEHWSKKPQVASLILAWSIIFFTPVRFCFETKKNVSLYKILKHAQTCTKMAHRLVFCEITIISRRRLANF